MYRDHGRLVGGLCRALLRDPAEAEDATQQVFLAAHRALLNGTSPREPAAWLAAIARNECWARIRTRMREPLPTDDVDGRRSASDPLADAIRNADLAAMLRAIAGLPKQQRDALLLREFGGLSYAELAGALAVSGPAVESLLFRARQGVRTRVEAAFAGLTGGSWLESLGRLAGGIGGGMAPVAAKVAAVGVGAAVATSGAVVAPVLVDHRPSRAVTPHHHTSVTTRRAAPTPVFVARRTGPATPAVSSPAAPTERRRGRASREDGQTVAPSGRGDSGEAEASDGAGNTETDPSESGKSTIGSAGEVTRQEDSSGKDGTGDAASPGPASSLQDGGPGSSDSGSGSSSGGGDSSSSGDGSDGGSNDGGDTATTTNPVVTIPVVSGDAVPIPGVLPPGDDG